ncbi:MAG: cytidylyltransferase domain-containing protein [Pseudomonadales bacterium]
MPLRGGSKSIPGKNIKELAGQPLFAWSLNAAVEANIFDEIHVATDSQRIAEVVARTFPGVSVTGRSPETATDSATTESIMLEFEKTVDYDVICLIQATSPLTRADDFIRAKKLFLEDSLDSLLTGTRSTEFLWSESGEPQNYDPQHRPMRQNATSHIIENGAFYFTSREILQQHACRLGGKIGICEMAPETRIEIDEPEDWQLIERILKSKTMPMKLCAGRVELLVLDVDGTLTDGGMYYSATGEALKRFNTRDAHGMALLESAGIDIAVMTAEDSPSVHSRMEKLGIRDYFPAVVEKLPLLREVAASHGLSLQQVAYMGDDLGDLDCLQAAGLALCPTDAVPEIRAAAHYVTSAAAGHGAVREICDLLLDARISSPA